MLIEKCMKKMINNYLIPTVIEKTYEGERAFDVYSRLLKERIIFLGGEIDDDIANVIVAQILLLEAEDKNKDIKIYINSPGGSVSAGMAIYDTIRYVKPDVSTICMGIAASMGAFLLAGGAKGKRFILPNARVMIHQPLGGVKGQASDIIIEADEIKKIRDILNSELSLNTGQSIKKIEKDTDRNFWMSAEDALKYGIVDKIIK